MKGFQFQGDKFVPGTVYHYEKSNIDGSHKHNISLYLADMDSIEAFKWHSNIPERTLVKAKIDWNIVSASQLETWQLHQDGSRTLIAIEKHLTESQQIAISVSAGSVQFEQILPIESYPWHSYDFDFASLNVSLRHLIDPLEPFTFGIADPDYEAKEPCFAWKGEVLVSYLSEEDRQGARCRKYSINGSGLKNRGGFLWVSKQEEHIVDYEIDLPDEPGFTSGKLALQQIERMDESQWQNFQNMCIDQMTQNVSEK